MEGPVLTEASDSHLAALLAAGEVGALAEIYDRYGALAYSVALRVLKDAGRAEDVVQECFLKLWQGASSFDAARGTLRGWLLSSVRNRAIDQLRGRAGHQRQELDLADFEDLTAAGAGADPWREVSAAMEREAVRAALERLPREQREAVELAYFGGYTYGEIAELANVPVSTIKGRMRLALEKLHSYLEGRGLFDDR
jgi:RNA polymerase sigma-70 factor (ECF subfamily)